MSRKIIFKYKTSIGKVHKFTKEDIEEMLFYWSEYKMADNLPKWLFVNGDVKSFAEGKRFLKLILKNAEL